MYLFFSSSIRLVIPLVSFIVLMTFFPSHRKGAMSSRTSLSFPWATEELTEAELIMDGFYYRTLLEEAAPSLEIKLLLFLTTLKLYV